MNLSRIDFALDDVEDGDVAALLYRTRYKNVLGLQKPSHDVKHSGLSNILLFELVKNQWSVPCHQEVASRSRYQRCNEAHQIVVHVTRVS
jgi:hypothetical protein